MRRTAGIIAVIAALSANAYGREKPAHKVKWKDVVVVEKQPQGCQDLGKIDAESLRFEPFSTNKGLKERAVKGLKKTAKLGGNTVYVAEKDASAWNADASGTAYWCDGDAQDGGAQDGGAGTGQATGKAAGDSND